MNPYLAEFIGTTILLFLGGCVSSNVTLNKTKGQNSGWIVITWGWGLSVAMAVYAVGRFSGAHINPAVTISMASIGQFSWSMVPGYILAQVLGAMAGATLNWLTYLPHWKETPDPVAKLAIFSTSPAIRSYGCAFLTEVIATAFLVFALMAIGANNEAFASNMSSIQGAGPIQAGLMNGFSTFMQPIIVGLLIFAIGLGLGGPTGYAINPARDLGPRIAHSILPIAGKGSSDWSYSWVPILAPILGGLIGAQLFVLLGM